MVPRVAIMVPRELMLKAVDFSSIKKIQVNNHAKYRGDDHGGVEPLAIDISHCLRILHHVVVSILNSR